MKNEYLRHTLATIDYSFQKSIRLRNATFGDYTLGKESRTPKEIINHMYAVLRATTVFIQVERIEKSAPEKLTLELEIERFNSEIKNAELVLSKNELDIEYSKKILQGPLSDLLTHIGQIAMLSRLNDAPIKREDFSASPINHKK